MLLGPFSPSGFACISFPGTRLKRLKGHGSYVNSVFPSRRGDPMIVSGSDDSSIKVWDQRKRNAVQTINNVYQVEMIYIVIKTLEFLSLFDMHDGHSSSAFSFPVQSLP